MTTHRETITVELTDEERGTVRLIPIDVTYLIERDSSYGADADGRRGVTSEEIYILDTSIAHLDLRTISVQEVCYVVDLAIRTITERTIAR